MLTLLLVACQGENIKTEAPTSPAVKPTEDIKPSVRPTEEDTYKLKLAGPGGAPAVAISELQHTYKDEYTFNVNLAPNALRPLFANKENDIIIAPIDMGAMQYSNNSNYVLGSVLTWGNLYFASQRPNFTLADIEGKEVIFFGANTVNEFIIKDIFFKKDIKPAVLTPLEDTKLTQAKLVSDENAICVVAEPLLSAAMSKKPNITAISIQDLFKEVSGQEGFAQASLH